jgi:ketosteroid isomerase-like protein
MKKYGILLTLVLTTHFALAQQALQQVEQAVSTWRTAVLAADVAALEPLMAEELSYGHSNARIEDKKEFLRVIASKENVYKRLDLTNQTVSIVEENMAIVRHTMSVDVVSGGKDQSFLIGVMQVWVKRKNKWQMLARQAFVPRTS